MTDQNQQPNASSSMNEEQMNQNMTSAVAASYVDDYTPPAATSAPVAASSPTPAAEPVTPAMPSTPAPEPVIPKSEPAQPAAMSTPAPSMPSHSSETSAPSSAPAKVSQTLEDQNIFHLLGIEDIADVEKESFLDELQQVIWEDFLENDVELLLTEEELADFKKIADKVGASEEQRQGEMITFLEKLIPDLEKIMLEKALELKEEMMRERIKELMNMYKDKPDMLGKVQSAQDLVDDEQWRAAADALNTL